MYGYKFNSKYFSGVDIADLESQIDTFLNNWDLVSERVKFNQAGTEAILIYYINKLGFIPPCVSFGFDNGYKECFTVYYPIFQATGTKMTVYVNASEVGGPSYCTWPELLTMKTNGHSIEDHNYDHTRMTEMTYQEIIDYAALTDAAFISNGLPAPNHLAYPYGSYNEYVINAVSTVRLSGRGIASSPKVYKDISKYEIPAINAETTPVVDIQALMDECVIYKNSLLIYAHTALSGPDCTTLVNYALGLGFNVCNFETLFALFV